jgi:hypothetical protein
MKQRRIRNLQLLFKFQTIALLVRTDLYHSDAGVWSHYCTGTPRRSLASFFTFNDLPSITESCPPWKNWFGKWSSGLTQYHGHPDNKGIRLEPTDGKEIVFCNAGYWLETETDFALFPLDKDVDLLTMTLLQKLGRVLMGKIFLNTFLKWNMTYYKFLRIDETTLNKTVLWYSKMYLICARNRTLLFMVYNTSSYVLPYRTGGQQR